MACVMCELHIRELNQMHIKKWYHF